MLRRTCRRFDYEPLPSIAAAAHGLVLRTRADMMRRSRTVDVPRLSSSLPSRNSATATAAPGSDESAIAAWRRKNSRPQQWPTLRLRIDAQSSDAWRGAQAEFGDVVVAPVAARLLPAVDRKRRDDGEVVTSTLDSPVTTTPSLVSPIAANISAATLLLNSFQYFDSPRADLIERLFDVVARGVAADNGAGAQRNIVVGAAVDAPPPLLGRAAAAEQAAGRLPRRNAAATVTATARSALSKRTLTDASFALQSCALSGFVRTSDLDTVVVGVCRARIAQLDAGILARCIVALALFRHRQVRGGHALRGADPLVLLLSALGSMHVRRLHDGTVRTALALRLLTCLRDHASQLRRARAEHVVEHLCAIVAGRGGGAAHNVVEGLDRCPVSRGRVPCAEQLQAAHAAATKLGVQVRWLERQLFAEAAAGEGVVTHRADGDDGGDAAAGGGSADEARGRATSIVDEYPVMDYIAAFGDSAAPEQPLAVEQPEAKEGEKRERQHRPRGGARHAR